MIKVWQCLRNQHYNWLLWLLEICLYVSTLQFIDRMKVFEWVAITFLNSRRFPLQTNTDIKIEFCNAKQIYKDRKELTWTVLHKKLKTITKIRDEFSILLIIFPFCGWWCSFATILMYLFVSTRFTKSSCVVNFVC